MRKVLILLVALAGLLAGGTALAQPAEPSPQELRALAELLRDPSIQAWLQAQAEGAPAGMPEAAAPDEPVSAQAVIAGRL